MAASPATFKIISTIDNASTGYSNASITAAVQTYLDSAAKVINSQMRISGTIEIDLTVAALATGVLANAGSKAAWSVDLAGRISNYADSRLELISGVDTLNTSSGADATLTVAPGFLASIIGSTSDSNVLQTIIHEIGHIQGMRSLSAAKMSPYEQQLKAAADGSMTFAGLAATAIAGSPIKMTSDGAHVFSDDIMQSILNPMIPGEFSSADLAIFRDIGYTIRGTLTSKDGATKFIGSGATKENGATNFDTAVLYGAIKDNQVTKTSAGFTITNTSIDQKVDLTGFEKVAFGDGTGLSINLAAENAVKVISTGDLNRITELYVAFFNRVPDADGIVYWAGQKAAGKSMESIAGDFYSAGVTMPEKTGYTPSMTNTDFIKLVYKNVLGRDTVDQGGLDYWNTELIKGTPRGKLVDSILSAAHSVKGDATHGWVADLLDNKLASASKIAVDWGINLTYDDAVKVAAAITPTGTSAAISLVGQVVPADWIAVVS